MRIKSLLFAIALYGLSTMSADAAKSAGIVRSFTQPDGTTISVQLLGDEHFSWYQTPDGILLKRADKAFYIATITSDGKLQPSSLLAHDLERRTEAEHQLAKAQKRALFFSKASQAKHASTRAISGYPSADNFCPHTGTVKIPVILMEYPDKPFTQLSETKSTKEIFDSYFNSNKTYSYSDNSLGGYSSVAQFFYDGSMGKLSFEFELFGPYTAIHKHDYYGKEGGKEFELIKEAVHRADSVIDFTRYDTDQNGKVDMVYVLYAGTGANLSNNDKDFWPKCYYGINIETEDSISINVIGGANELVREKSEKETAIRAGIGVTCHEIGHGIGLPDLYWTRSDDPIDADGYTDYNNCGPEGWDLMDGGENLYNGIWPCQFTAWEREILGWLDVQELTEPTHITLYPLNKKEGSACRVTNPENANEYYIIENYAPDEWNEYVNRRYGSGLMITHVNTSAAGLSMSPNNTYGKPNVTILPADNYILALYSNGKTIRYRGQVVTMPSARDIDENNKRPFYESYYYPEMKGDPYVGSKSSAPVNYLAAYKNYTGEEMATRFPITDITRNDDGSISFKFMGGEVSAIGQLTDTKRIDSRVYTLEGREVKGNQSSLPQGLYIQNREKKLIR